MKTMTCHKLGGPCEASFHGNTADAVIQAQDTHEKTWSPEGMNRTGAPFSGMEWYVRTKKAFAALPEDRSAIRTGCTRETCVAERVRWRS